MTKLESEIVRTRAQQEITRRCVGVEIDVHRMRRDAFLYIQIAIEMFTAAEAVLRKRWHNFWRAEGSYSFQSNLRRLRYKSIKGNHADSTVKFREFKVQSPFRIWRAHSVIIPRKASQDRQSKKRQTHGGENGLLRQR